MAKDTLHGDLISIDKCMQLTRLSKQDWVRILTDPDPQEMARLLHVGQFVTWPKVRDILVYNRTYCSLVLSYT
jgi:hypothetical protein